MSGSNWLPSYCKRLVAGEVARYVTRTEHVDRKGRVYPRGTHCRVLRAPSGELCVLFWNLGNGPVDMSAVWLPAGYGLVGVEPNVCDPELENSGHLREVIAEVDAGVRRYAEAWEQEVREEFRAREEEIVDLSYAQAREELAEITLKEMSTELGEEVEDRGEAAAVAGRRGSRSSPTKGSKKSRRGKK